MTEWVDVTVRPAGKPEVNREPDNTIEVHAAPVTLLLTEEQAVELFRGLAATLYSEVPEPEPIG